MYKEKICRVCGKVFVPQSSRQLDCNQPVIRTCVICGTQFERRCSSNDTSTTCSDKCTQALAKHNRESVHQKNRRSCAMCGAEFSPVNNTQKYCKRFHEAKCVICGTEYLVDTRKQEMPKTCSKECAIQLRFKNGNPFQDSNKRKHALENYLERTGYTHPMRNPEVIEKLRETCRDRYGADWYTQTDEYVDKAKATNQQKYGTDWAIQNQDIQRKRRENLIAKYGAYSVMLLDTVVARWKESYLANTGYEHPSQNPEVVARTKSTNIQKYGCEYAIASSEVREKSAETMIQKYGVPNAMQSPEIRQKVFDTNIKRYGNISFLGSEQGRKAKQEGLQRKYNVDHFSSSRMWKFDRMLDNTKIDNWMSFLHDPEIYLDAHFSDRPTLRELSLDVGVTESTTSYFIIKYNMQDKIRYVLSHMEDEVAEALRSIDPNIKIVRHQRTLLPGRELDLYLPEHHIAIECNPTVTHNSSVPDPWGSLPKPYNYHLLKTLGCEANGIFLFHLFGSEWTHSKDIILSMFRNLLTQNSRKVYARKCDVRFISSKVCTQFLRANHRQGAANSSIRLGLFLGDELVSVMTFGKMRNTIGTDSTDLSDCFELVRFCSLLNTSVVGGANKLFKHFIRNYRPERVRSFSDRAHTRGELYAKLGFTKIRESDPGYVWVDSRTDISYHRYSAQKHNIKKFLHDDDIDLSKTEKQIMEEHGFLQVFDCGTVLWEWRAT